MKVTVCFGPTRVIVPCGNGQMLVRELVDAAVRRYKKATAKPSDSWVLVHNLKSLADGGILDPDDQLQAVCDDKEQILAIYDEQDPLPSSVHLGMEASSSVGTSSPDYAMHHQRERPVVAPKPNLRDKTVTVAPSSSSLPGGVEENSVEITSLDAPPSSGLSVLGRNSPSETAKKKRQAPAPPKLAPISSVSSNEPEPSPSSPSPPRANGYIRGTEPSSKFVRSSARQSTLADKWLDAAGKAEERYWSLERQEPIGQETSREPSPNTHTLVVTLAGHGKPLGVQVAPEYGANGKLNGVKVTQIHEDGRVFADQRLQVDDVITEINGRPIYQMSFVRAQTYLHEVGQQGAVSLQVLRGSDFSGAEDRKLAEPSVSGATGPLNSLPRQSALQKANTKKIGHKMSIDLNKGAQGLGFTVTSRDTALDSVERPFYIKTILPKGAAIEDGRLKAGDRLLEVNGDSLSGLGQSQVVNLLRQFRQGDCVSLLISRQQKADQSSRAETSDDGLMRPGSRQRIVGSPNLPRPLPSAEELELEENDTELITYDIALNDTGSAGLGVSVKGRTANGHGIMRDCGIYVKTIMHGGAAHKDGRLRVNDHLLAINDTHLSDVSNELAMRLIGQTMQNLESGAKSIRLEVQRSVNTNPLDVSGSPDEGESMYLDLERGTHTLVPGYGEYAVVVKSPSVTVAAQNHDTHILVDDSGHEIVHKENLYEDVSLYHENDQFARDAPGRQSMSEKRHGTAGKADPSHTQTYQRIKHSRQTSAPTLNDVPLVTDVKPETSTPKSITVPDLKVIAALEAGERRSMSVESLSQLGTLEKQEPMIHELAVKSNRSMGPAMKKVQRSRPQNDSFRQAVDKSYNLPPGEVGVDIGSDDERAKVSNGPQPSVARPSKDKDRRKSTGSGGIFSKSWFSRLGSGRSRESSPEKKLVDEEQTARDKAKLAAQEEQKRIREQYERLKLQQQDLQRHRRISSPQSKLSSQWPPGSPHTKQRSMSSVNSAPKYPAPPVPSHRLRNESEPPPYAPNRLTRHEPQYRMPLQRPCPALYYPGANHNMQVWQNNNGSPWFIQASETTRFYRSLDRSPAGVSDVGRGSSGRAASRAGGSGARLPPSTVGRAPNPRPSTQAPSPSSKPYEQYLRAHKRSAARIAPSASARPQSEFFDYERVSPQGRETVYDYVTYDSR